MNFGVIRERGADDQRVALTPPVVHRLVAAGHAVWVESGAGDGALFPDHDYIRAGAQIAYAPAEVIQRCDVLAKISRPSPTELALCPPGMVLLAFLHLAVADAGTYGTLIARRLTAIGCEVVQREDGSLPVLAAISEIAGQMAIPIAAHLLRSSSGGRGILLGGTPGVPPAHVVIVGAGTVGSCAARRACYAGARVTVFDVDPSPLRRLIDRGLAVETRLADRDAIAAAVATADVVIGAVLVAGSRTPHVVTRAMVETMQPGAAILDVSIDQGGCVETSRPTTIADPTFQHRRITHFCVPNFTADLGRSSSTAIAQALLPYLLAIGNGGVDGALAHCPDLARGVYTHAGRPVHPWLQEAQA
jgi:alanine dehydrogenase